MKKWLWEMIYCFWRQSCLMPTQRQEILQHFTTHFKGSKSNPKAKSKRWFKMHPLFQHSSPWHWQCFSRKVTWKESNSFAETICYGCLKYISPMKQCKELQEQIEVQSMWRQPSNQPSQLWSKSKSSQENSGS